MQSPAFVQNALFTCTNDDIQFVQIARAKGVRAKGVRPNVTRSARDIWPDPFGTVLSI